MGNSELRLGLVLLLVFGIGEARAQLRSSDDYEMMDALDTAVGRASSAAYTNDFSLGGFSGSSSGGEMQSRNGFLAMLHEVVGLAFPSIPSEIDEETSLQLKAAEEWDDGTFWYPPAQEVEWTLVSGGDYASISLDGLLETYAVYESTEIGIQAVRAPFTGSLGLTIRDNEEDNFGSYSEDGLPDWWQVLHFGIDNSEAGPGMDSDGDGRDNETEYFSGTSPSDTSSFFSASMVLSEEDDWYIHFDTILDRSYSLQTSTLYAADTWTDIEGPLAGTGERMSFLLPEPSGAGHLNFRVIMRP